MYLLLLWRSLGMRDFRGAYLISYVPSTLDLPAALAQPLRELSLQFAADTRPVVREVELIAGVAVGHDDDLEVILPFVLRQHCHQFSQPFPVGVEALAATKGEAQDAGPLRFR
jgi:hypothetical protein